MLRTCGWLIALVLVASPVIAADGKYSVRSAKNAPPKGLKEPIAKVLAASSLEFLDEKGAVIAEVWLRTEVPAKATAEQIKNGLTYREVEEGTLFAAVRFDRTVTDYRKQKIMPGVYTLRLGFQPMDGDHMGTAPYSEFFLIVPAATDDKPDATEAKQLREDSAKAAKTSHPAVLLLFPNSKPENEPKLVSKENNHWVLFFKAPVAVESQKTTLGVGLVLVGHSTLE
jgi:hypothetical protein